MELKEQFSCEQLLALAQDILHQVHDVKCSSEDNEFDEEYKRGLREAFLKVNNMIYERCEVSMGEQK